jgi:glycosyltransferase involved in cell wall biosynthesis
MSILERLTRKKLKNYKWIITSNFNRDYKFVTNLVLNLDDPAYSDSEIEDLILWEQSLKDVSKRGVIIVTSEKTRKYLIDAGLKSSVYILEQGFTINNLESELKNKRFSIVYSSPYIDSQNDGHGAHPTWGVDLFIKEIIPKITDTDSSIEIHLIGRTGLEASKFLGKFSQVKLHGLKSFNDNAELLQRAHVGIYPRKIDNGRRVQKIYEYIGANLPIVTFDLEDTRPVSELGVGISVNTTDEFVKAIVDLKNDQEMYNKFYSKLLSVKEDYSWKNLAKRFDKLVYDSFP